MQLDLLSQNLVEEKNGELFVSSIIIAENVNYEHQSVIKLIRGNIEDFNEFESIGIQE
jgi:phage regulator Rha-like protein